MKTTHVPTISKYFIYDDHSYRAFFTSSLTRAYQFIFHVSFNNLIIGFEQLKIVANTLLLNNLVVKTNYQNNKLGSRLPTYGIIAARSAAPYINFSRLSAFVSNTSPKWYLRLGMKIVNIDYWYNLNETNFSSDPIISNKELANIKYITDQIGITQLFLNNLPVGYLINGRKLTLKGKIHFAYLAKIPQMFNKQEIELGCSILDVVLDLPLIYRSYLLRIPISDLQFVNDHLRMSNN